MHLLFRQRAPDVIGPHRFEAATFFRNLLGAVFRLGA
jgi:hypothetical protein